MISAHGALFGKVHMNREAVAHAAAVLRDLQLELGRVPVNRVRLRTQLRVDMGGGFGDGVGDGNGGFSHGDAYSDGYGNGWGHGEGNGVRYGYGMGIFFRYGHFGRVKRE